MSNDDFIDLDELEERAIARQGNRKSSRKSTKKRHSGSSRKSKKKSGSSWQKRLKRNWKAYLIRLLLIVAAVLIIFGVISLVRFTVTSIASAISGARSKQTVQVEEQPVEEEPQVAEPVVYTEEAIDFNPAATENTRPSNLIESTDIQVDGNILSDVSEYSGTNHYNFGVSTEYTDAQGIITFRGNNFRNNPTYGFAEMSEYKFGKLWSVETSSLMSGSAYWSGSGWTGQPLIVKWPKETKAIMNMYDWAKEDDNLVEVIYACMDGYIYFIDLWTGQKTRDDIYLGFTFKGAGALDPRGYPIMYLGAGYNSDNGTSRAFIISLVDGSTLYEFGCEDEFTYRGSLSFFDGSALVSAENDTLIYPGENGIVYLIKLNTAYDQSAGTLSINPSDIVKWRYNGLRSSSDTFWWGMEDSAAIYKNYLFVAENGGHLFCLNLDNLQLVWVQDVLDDTNDSPVLSIENGKLYLYISTSFRYGWRSYDTATIPIWKIDAETGEIVWQYDYTCYTIEDVSGGVQSTIACGRYDLSDYIYVTVSDTDEANNGVLACFNKTTGALEWEHHAHYAWSSPDCVYNSDGSGVVIYCDSSGQLYMVDGLTGEVKDQFTLSEGTVEASPAVYENILVMGTRDCEICGIELK